MHRRIFCTKHLLPPLMLVMLVLLNACGGETATNEVVKQPEEEQELSDSVAISGVVADNGTLEGARVELTSLEDNSGDTTLLSRWSRHVLREIGAAADAENYQRAYSGSSGDYAFTVSRSALPVIITATQDGQTFSTLLPSVEDDAATRHLNHITSLITTEILQENNGGVGYNPSQEEFDQAAEQIVNQVLGYRRDNGSQTDEPLMDFSQFYSDSGETFIQEGENSTPAGKVLTALKMQSALEDQTDPLAFLQQKLEEGSEALGLLEDEDFQLTISLNLSADGLDAELFNRDNVAPEVFAKLQPLQSQFTSFVADDTSRRTELNQILLTALNTAIQVVLDAYSPSLASLSDDERLTAVTLETSRVTGILSDIFKDTLTTTNLALVPSDEQLTVAANAGRQTGYLTAQLLQDLQASDVSAVTGGGGDTFSSLTGTLITEVIEAYVNDGLMTAPAQSALSSMQSDGNLSSLLKSDSGLTQPTVVSAIPPFKGTPEAFQVNDQVLEDLVGKVSDDVLEQIGALKGQQFKGPEQFLDAVEDLVGEAKAAESQAALLSNAKMEDDKFVVSASVIDELEDTLDDEVMEQVRPLQGAEFDSQEAFEEVLEELLGEETLAEVKEDILAAAKEESGAPAAAYEITQDTLDALPDSLTDEDKANIKPMIGAKFANSEAMQEAIEAALVADTLENIQDSLISEAAVESTSQVVSDDALEALVDQIDPDTLVALESLADQSFASEEALEEALKEAVAEDAFSAVENTVTTQTASTTTSYIVTDQVIAALESVLDAEDLTKAEELLGQEFATEEQFQAALESKFAEEDLAAAKDELASAAKLDEALYVVDEVAIEAVTSSLSTEAAAVLVQDERFDRKDEMLATLAARAASVSLTASQAIIQAATVQPIPQYHITETVLTDIAEEVDADIITDLTSLVETEYTSFQAMQDDVINALSGDALTDEVKTAILAEALEQPAYYGVTDTNLADLAILPSSSLTALEVIKDEVFFSQESFETELAQVLDPSTLTTYQDFIVENTLLREATYMLTSDRLSTLETAGTLTSAQVTSLEPIEDDEYLGSDTFVTDLGRYLASDRVDSAKEPLSIKGKIDYEHTLSDEVFTALESTVGESVMAQLESMRDVSYESEEAFITALGELLDTATRLEHQATILDSASQAEPTYEFTEEAMETLELALDPDDFADIEALEGSEFSGATALAEQLVNSFSAEVIAEIESEVLPAAQVAVPAYEMTEDALTALEEQLGSDVSDSLQSLKGETFASQEALIEAVAELLGDETAQTITENLKDAAQASPDLFKVDDDTLSNLDGRVSDTVLTALADLNGQSYATEEDLNAAVVGLLGDQVTDLEQDQIAASASVIRPEFEVTTEAMTALEDELPLETLLQVQNLQDQCFLSQDALQKALEAQVGEESAAEILYEVVSAADQRPAQLEVTEDALASLSDAVSDEAKQALEDLSGQSFSSEDALAAAMQTALAKAEMNAASETATSAAKQDETTYALDEDDLTQIAEDADSSTAETLSALQGQTFATQDELNEAIKDQLSQETVNAAIDQVVAQTLASDTDYEITDEAIAAVAGNLDSAAQTQLAALKGITYEEKDEFTAALQQALANSIQQKVAEVLEAAKTGDTQYELSEAALDKVQSQVTDSNYAKLATLQGNEYNTAGALQAALEKKLGASAASTVLDAVKEAAAVEPAFMLDEEALTELEGQLSSDTLATLQELKDVPFISEDRLTDKLTSKLGETEAEAVKDVVLAAANLGTVFYALSDEALETLGSKFSFEIVQQLNGLLGMEYSTQSDFLTAVEGVVGSIVLPNIESTVVKLATVDGVAYMITDQSFTRMSGQVSTSVQDQLATLQGTEYDCQDNYISALQSTLGTATYSALDSTSRNALFNATRFETPSYKVDELLVERVQSDLSGSQITQLEALLGTSYDSQSAFLSAMTTVMGQTLATVLQPDLLYVCLKGAAVGEAFEVDATLLEALAAEVDTATLSAVTALQNQTFNTEEDFLAALSDTLSAEALQLVTLVVEEVLEPVKPEDEEADQLEAVQVELGKRHSCAVLSDSTVQCWGSGAERQLQMSQTEDSQFPKEVEGIESARFVATGSNHTCALLSDKTVQCWGAYLHGQLGNQDDLDFSSHVQVSSLTNAKLIKAGGFHTCALTANGQLKCWGDGRFGQLGNGATEVSYTPVKVSGLNGSVRDFSAGRLHTCVALRNGTVQCWGSQRFGQLGNGTISEDGQSSPVTVDGISGATEVSTGAAHSCALLFSGAVYCWGEGIYGQLGHGLLQDSSTPVKVLDISTATQIDSGDYHSCAVLSNGSIRCWGAGWEGRLGDGSLQSSPTPVRVRGIANASQVATGGFHSCALLHDTTVKCWGGGTSGQLGNGNKDNAEEPQLVRKALPQPDETD